MNPLQVIYSVLALLIVAGVGTWIYKCESAMTFAERAAILAEDAKKKAELETRRLKVEKEKADAAIQTLRADNVSLDKRLSSERARSRELSRPAPLTPSPERACFKGPVFDAAIARFLAETSAADLRLYEETAEIARSGTDTVSALDSAKLWAKDIQP